MQPKWSDPEIKLVSHVEEEANSYAELAKLEIPYEGTLKQCTTNPSVIAWIQLVHWEYGPDIMASELQDMYFQL